MRSLENQLTDVELSYLKSAREHQHEVYALEEYSHLWDELEQRLGENNKLVKHFVKEYQRREFLPARDGEEDRRLQFMRTSFVFPRTMPKNVVSALLAYGIFGR